MTTSLPGLPPIDQASAGVVPPNLRTVDGDDRCEAAGPGPTAVGDFFVDWQLVVSTGARR